MTSEHLLQHRKLHFKYFGRLTRPACSNICTFCTLVWSSFYGSDLEQNIDPFSVTHVTTTGAMSVHDTQRRAAWPTKVFLKASIIYQTLSYNRQILTSPLDGVLCLIGI